MSTLPPPAPADADLARLLTELLARLGPPPAVPLAGWRDAVLATYGSRARSTRDRMGQALRETLALAGPGATTAALTPALIARLAARPGPAATTDGLLSALRAACRLGVAWGQVGPAQLAGARWRTGRCDSPRARHHGRAEIARVLAHLRAAAGSWEGGRLYALAAVLAYTGVRKMEALRLRAHDVDLARGFLFVKPNGRPLKTPGSEAPVPMPRALVSILRRWLARCGPSGWAFPGATGRGPWTGGTSGRRAGDRLKAAGAAVGVAGFTPRSLRHSLATHLAGAWGLTDRQVQLVLRHTRATTQAHYVHPDLVTLGELVAGFDFARAPRRAVAPAPRPRRRAG